jgi:hypothetical protein
MIEIDSRLYKKMSRKNALALLERAELAPDKFIAHKDKTFTAKFRRKRKRMFQTQGYEDRMEQFGDYQLAILKRPSVRIDRGPYITLRFAFAALDTLGVDKIKLPTKKAVPNGKAKPAVNGTGEKIDAIGIGQLVRLAGDIKNLAHEAHKMAKEPEKHKHHLEVLLEELEKHADEMLKALK